MLTGLESVGNQVAVGSDEAGLSLTDVVAVDEQTAAPHHALQPQLQRLPGHRRRNVDGALIAYLADERVAARQSRQLGFLQLRRERVGCAQPGIVERAGEGQRVDGTIE